MPIADTQQTAYRLMSDAAAGSPSLRAGEAGPAGTSRQERLRAHGALITLWAGLAIAILAMAIARESIAALALGAGAIWLLRAAWAAAFRRSEDEPAPITFR